MEPAKIKILDIEVSRLTLPEALREIDRFLTDGRGHYIVTPNPEFALEALSNPSFRRWVNQADLALADGVGLLWASFFNSLLWPRSIVLKMLALPFLLPFSLLLIILAPRRLAKVLPERLSGADVLIEAIKLAARRGVNVFFLGGREGVARAASEQLRGLYPQLAVAGALAGPPFQSEDFTLDALRQSQPQLILLALPQEQQMLWTEKLFQLLPAGIVIGIGGALDFIVGATAYQDPSGKYKAVRAPYWMRKRGLEWLWRLLTQPWRARRIFQAVIRFIGEVVKNKMRNKQKLLT